MSAGAEEEEQLYAPGLSLNLSPKLRTPKPRPRAPVKQEPKPTEFHTLVMFAFMSKNRFFQMSMKDRKAATPSSPPHTHTSPYVASIHGFHTLGP